MTLLAFLFAIGLLVAVHEWGHYRVAVACGVKVYTFSIGLGPTLFRWRLKRSHPGQDTEFQIRLFPLGGYVRMADEREGDVIAADLPMAFNRQALRSRAAIVLAGPLANLMLAVLLFGGMNWVGRYETAPILSAPLANSEAGRAGFGSGDKVLRVGLSDQALMPAESLEALQAWVNAQDTTQPLYFELRAQDSRVARIVRLDGVGETLVHSDPWRDRGLGGPWSKPVVGHVLPQDPADLAGLKSGDEVLRIDGESIDDASQLRMLIRLSGKSQQPSEQVWQIVRQNHALTLVVTPVRVAEGDAWIGRVGAQIGDAPERIWLEYRSFDAVERAFAQTWQNATMTVGLLGRLLVSAATWEQVGGPLMIADYAGRSAQMGLGVYLGYLATLSVSLGVFNLLPFPVLDGGHLLYYLYEFVTGKSPSESWLGMMQRLGLVLLFSLMIFSLLNDAARLGWMG